jgi:hypothetical protein
MRFSRLFWAALLVSSFASFAYAGTPAPEMDMGVAGSACVLVGGAVLVIRGRRRVRK